MSCLYNALSTLCHVLLCCIQTRWFYTSLLAYFTTAIASLKFISSYFLSNKYALGGFTAAYNSNRSTMLLLSYVYYISWTFLSPNKTVFWLQICFFTCYCSPLLNYLYQIVQSNRGCERWKCSYWINVVQLWIFHAQKSPEASCLDKWYSESNHCYSANTQFWEVTNSTLMLLGSAFMVPYASQLSQCH